MELPKKFRYKHKNWDNPNDSGVVTVDGKNITVEHDDGYVSRTSDSTYDWTAEDAKRYVESGMWLIEEVLEPAPSREVRKGIVFSYVARPDDRYLLQQDGDSFFVEWYGPLQTKCWYTREQATGFIQNGTWIVHGVQ